LPLPAGQARCGACLLHPSPLDACFAAVDYAWPWSALITRWKFQHTPGWAQPLSSLMLGAEGVPQALADADLVIPMPLSAQRLRERGFNQALVLARCLARRKVQAQLLLRMRDTAAQSRLGRDARQRNVRDAFAVEPLRTGELQGRRVVLVDDVMTSGASLHAAARALRAAGARRITALVIARTQDGHAEG
jgi:ComF family protein